MAKKSTSIKRRKAKCTMAELEQRIIKLEDALADCIVLFDSFDGPRIVQRAELYRWAGLGKIGLGKKLLPPIKIIKIFDGLKLPGERVIQNRKP